MEEKKKRKFSKDTLNIIRTTMRNSIELTHIADNKANVLLSLNALMITFLIPLTIPNFDFVIGYNLTMPLLLLVATCLVTIYITALVLKPSRISQNHKALKKGNLVSPFFFGNIYKMNKEEFGEFIHGAVSKKELVSMHLTEDLHFIGSRLGKKMILIRLAFSIFLFGLFVSITSAILMISFTNNWV